MSIILADIILLESHKWIHKKNTRQFMFWSRNKKIIFFSIYSKTFLKWPLKKDDQKLFFFLVRLSLNAGQNYCRILKESILQYFQPLSYHLSLRPLICLFLNGGFRQVSLYTQI